MSFLTLRVILILIFGHPWERDAVEQVKEIGLPLDKQEPRLKGLTPSQATPSEGREEIQPQAHSPPRSAAVLVQLLHVESRCVFHMIKEIFLYNHCVTIQARKLSIETVLTRIQN